MARALARDIKLLLLYEPYERIVQAIKQRGITTIIVEQNAVAALELANALILDRGHIVFDGTAKAVLDNAELRNEYLAI